MDNVEDITIYLNNPNNNLKKLISYNKISLELLFNYVLNNLDELAQDNKDAYNDCLDILNKQDYNI